MITLGLDRTAERQASAYPFVDSWDREIGGVALPAGSIYALQVYVEPAMMPPVHISQLQRLGAVVELTFADADNRLVGTAAFSKTSMPQAEQPYTLLSRQILRKQAIAAGLITCSPEFVEWLFA